MPKAIGAGISACLYHGRGFERMRGTLCEYPGEHPKAQRQDLGQGTKQGGGSAARGQQCALHGCVFEDAVVNPS